MKSWVFDYQGQRHTLISQWVGDKLWVHVGGRIFTVNDPRIKSRKKGGGNLLNHPDQIKAPMPGRVTKVAVKEGDIVKAGQILVTMEAMKMEYTLKAEVDGVVTQVKVKLAQQVVLGETLVQLKL